MREKIESFPQGSAAGASGFRPQFLQDMLACPNAQIGKEALKTLTLLTSHLFRERPQISGTLHRGGPSYGTE